MGVCANMKRLFSFRELEKPAQLAARKKLLCEMESLFYKWKNVKAFAYNNTFDTGIIVRPEDVYVTEDDNVILLPHKIVLDVALRQSGIDKQCLTSPEYRELFLVNANAKIRQVSSFPFDVRFVLISIEITPFENNDNGKAFFACEVASSLLEVYLNRLVVTISNSFRAKILKEHARISSPAFLDEYLEQQGEVFFRDGSFSPLFNDTEEIRDGG